MHFRWNTARWSSDELKNCMHSSGEKILILYRKTKIVLMIFNGKSHLRFRIPVADSIQTIEGFFEFVLQLMSFLLICCHKVLIRFLRVQELNITHSIWSFSFFPWELPENSKSAKLNLSCMLYSCVAQILHLKIGNYSKTKSSKVELTIFLVLITLFTMSHRTNWNAINCSACVTHSVFHSRADLHWNNK